MKNKEILGVRVNTGLTVEHVISMVESMLKDEKAGHYICTTNPEFVMEAQKDGDFREIINSADLSVPDGVGILAAEDYLDKVSLLKRDFLFVLKAFLLGLRVGFKTIVGGCNGGRVTGVCLADELFKLSSEKGCTIFLLGGWPRDWAGRNLRTENDFATIAAKAVLEKYPGVVIVGSTSEFSSEERDDERTLEFIKNKMKEKEITKIDILMVAYGQKKQEKWIVRNSSKIPTQVSIGLGGTFDYIAGHYKQIPPIVTKVGLEWLVRLLTQPFRIRRIINAFPIFPFKVFLSSLKTYNRQ
jgi:N-acetylglucosaminyldiphosphoundecaprenol N-acetyl-beta-D-mannosaminyltransferase